MRVAPYGTWSSPVTMGLVAGQTVSLGSLVADADTLFWLEQRPSEKGRTVVVCRAPDGSVADITPPPLDVATRVHEYGGGAYHACDGRVVFSDRRDGAVLVLEAGAAPRRITSVPGCRYADFRIAPDGRSAIAVREDARHRPANDPENTIVRLDLADAADAAANEGVVLVRGADFVSNPRLSADGTALAWLEWDHPDMPWDATRLRRAALGADGMILDARTVAGGAGISIVQPEWDGDAILYATDATGWWNLARADAAGGTEALCPMAAEIGGPAWAFGRRYHDRMPDGRIVAAVTAEGSSSTVLIDRDGATTLAIGPVAECPVVVGSRLACLLAPPEAPPSIALVGLDGRGPVEIVRRSAPASLVPDDVSLPRPLAFPADDGATGHAWWYPPTNASHRAPEGDRPPLVVISHGGPTGMASDAFSPRVQWWTSRGFAVVDVNYGGSTGFGRDYRRRLEGRWGVVDVADCIAAVRHLVETDCVDRRRIVIRGGSAGGLTTLLCLASSDLFAAGASLYGVTDLTLLAGETHKFEARYLDRLVAPLEGHRSLYEERSPIAQVDRIGCPVIFFQGLDDKVVPPNQARTMAASLARRGLAAPLHEFAGEGHGFRRQDTIRRVLALELAFYAEILGLEIAAD